MAATLPESGIMAVINYGREKAGVIPFWAGEGDAPTPAFIAEAAIEALRQGHTFYTYQRGIRHSGKLSRRMCAAISWRTWILSGSLLPGLGCRPLCRPCKPWWGRGMRSL